MGNHEAGDMENALRKRKIPPCDLQDKFDKLSTDIKKLIENWQLDLNTTMQSLNSNVSKMKADLDLLAAHTKDLKQDFSSLRDEFVGVKAKTSVFQSDIREMKSSIEYNSGLYTDLDGRLERLEKNMEVELDSLQQHARQCNIEISNLPEKRDENLTSVLDTIGSKMQLTISQKDVISIHRVPHAQPNVSRPKNIIVKLSSRTLRDNILTAYRKVKGMNTEQLGFSGTTKNIFMNEHLTLKRKQLFRKCREVAKQCNYKYIWIKHATILVREFDTSPVLAIRSEEDINKKIKPKKNNSDVD